MEMLLYAKALLMGLVEGLTEFIPVSSTGHLILLGEWIGFEGPPGKLFEAFIQLGAILAICYLYRRKLWVASCGVFTSPVERRFAIQIALAFLPAAVLGVLFHDIIKTHFFRPQVVAVALIVGGVIILLIERFRPEPRITHNEAIGYKRALQIGLFQAVAMIPGVSRSGATIMGGLLLRLDRPTATEFSFFLAIPTMLAATLYDLYKNAHLLDGQDAAVLAIGFCAAFGAAMLVVRTLIAFVSRHGFAPFAYYRIALGGVMLLLS